MPEPSPFVHVTDAARPSPSTTEMCVVPPSREDRKRSRKPGSARPSTNSSVRASWAVAIASTMSAMRGGPGVRSSRPSARARSVPPAEGGGFVSTASPR